MFVEKKGEWKFMNGLRYYTKKVVQPAFPWEQGTDMNRVSVSTTDEEGGSPKKGDMIAINPSNPTDKWLIAEKFFNANYIEQVS